MLDRGILWFINSNRQVINRENTYETLQCKRHNQQQQQQRRRNTFWAFQVINGKFIIKWLKCNGYIQLFTEELLSAAVN